MFLPNKFKLLNSSFWGRGLFCFFLLFVFPSQENFNRLLSICKTSQTASELLMHLMFHVEKGSIRGNNSNFLNDSLRFSNIVTSLLLLVTICFFPQKFICQKLKNNILVEPLYSHVFQILCLKNLLPKQRKIPC